MNWKADGGLELPLKNVQERLGHASVAITSYRYGHLFPRGDDGANERSSEAERDVNATCWRLVELNQ